MPTAYFNGFDTARIDAGGIRIALAGVSFNVHKVVGGASLGTVVSDAFGYVADQTLADVAGTVVEFSHATYPLTFRRTLAASADAARALTENLPIAYIAQDLSTDRHSVKLEVWLHDLDNADAADQFIGFATAAETTAFSFETLAGRSLRVYGQSVTAEDDRKHMRYQDAQYHDLAVAGRPEVTPYTDEKAQDAVGTILTDTPTIDFTYDDPTPFIKADVKDDSIDNPKLANMATKTYKGRTSGTTGDPEDVPVATLKTDLVLVKGDVGLGNVDNTSDANKPVSTAQAAADTAAITTAENYAIARAHHTGTQTASTISDFNAAALAAAPAETAASIAAIIHAETAKTVLVDGDEWTLDDSGASFGGKKATLEFLFAYMMDKFNKRYSGYAAEFDAALLIGNSMTYYPSSLWAGNWWGSWGVGATTKAKDMAHQFGALMSQWSPNIIVYPKYYGASSFEANHHSFALSGFDTDLNALPKRAAIIYRAGENVPNDGNLSNYQNDLIAAINYWKLKCPQAKILITSTFWQSSYYDTNINPAQYNAAIATNVDWCSFEGLDDQTTATRLGTGIQVYGDDNVLHTSNDAAIGAHPNNVSLLAMAQRMYDKLNDIKPYISGYYVDAGRTSGGTIGGIEPESGYVSFGSIATYTQTIDTSLIVDGPAGTDAFWDTLKYDSTHWEFGNYNLPAPLVPNAQYKLELFCADNSSTGTGQHVFTLTVNGVSTSMTGPASSGTTYDPYAQAGSVQLKGTVATATVTASLGGRLILEINTSTGQGIYGIRITKVV